MDPKYYNLACFLLALPQAAAAAIQVYKWWKGRGMKDKPRFEIPFWLILVGFLAPIACGVYLAYHSPKPVVKTEIKTVERVVNTPCPAVKTGSVTAKSGQGGIAFGHSGNGDTFSVPPPIKK